ncbi:TetR/AcrR family transcriptional regulator [Amycolatopsis thermophila]|uniref:AcrR family transcriptional regulator n=1 Tax=Amycolatopsis thermophila TaxID=206084 RepID=A0ABU0F295_9PSEU|nr:TetR/AcrR family transcriptional regulator [Amycolatopsis thermophila]MDQ0381687.1 AcrR family transcriptional regulator [Amycolatopsis thermophila]
MTEPKPLRADARRNRARVLDAAETVFAARGTGAPTEEVAREAGVGIGTVFRHFPTKAALLEAVLAERMRRFVEEAQSFAAAEDPESAFFVFLGRWAEMSAAKNAYTDALAAAGADVPRLGPEIGAQVREAVGALLSRAQLTGAVREDVGVTELIALMVGAARAAEYLGEDAALRARTLGIVFDGLRAR